MIALLLVSLLAAAPAVPDSIDDADRHAEVMAAVRQYARPVDASLDSVAVRVAWVDVSGDGRDDALVYLTAGDWCGSGGCTVLVFEAMDEIDAEEMGAYRPAAEISMMHGSVHVVAGRRGTWSDLIVQDENGVARRLSFDGETYPFSPAGGRVIRGATPAGTTLFADAR